jgi:peptidoglycan/LPS O-acetylase OafA/YrhL
VVVTLFATLSWRLIEKPILKLRKNFSFVAREREQEAAAANRADPAALGLAPEQSL